MAAVGVKGLHVLVVKHVVTWYTFTEQQATQEIFIHVQKKSRYYYGRVCMTSLNRLHDTALGLRRVLTESSRIFSTIIISIWVKKFSYIW